MHQDNQQSSLVEEGNNFNNTYIINNGNMYDINELRNVLRSPINQVRASAEKGQNHHQQVSNSNEYSIPSDRGESMKSHNVLS